MTGEFVPLDEQDTRLWDAALIARGESLLHRAHGMGRPGRYQYEAAIQSTHCARSDDWMALRKLHRRCCGLRHRWVLRSHWP